MLVLPVLDMKNGRIVRGLAGRRQDYQPIQSVLTPSCQPVDVARAFRDHWCAEELYLADLDAIAGAPPALDTYAAIQSLGCRLWVDAGIRGIDTAMPLAEVGIASIVFGLETIAGPEVLMQACQRLGVSRVVLSIDMKEGRLLGNTAGWENSDPYLVAVQAMSLGVRRIILLDLARVGMDQGVGTEAICARLALEHPEVEITVGGGVRDAADLHRLRGQGASVVLVASAFHEGRLTLEDVVVGYRSGLNEQDYSIMLTI